MNCSAGLAWPHVAPGRLRTDAKVSPGCQSLPFPSALGLLRCPKAVMLGLLPSQRVLPGMFYTAYPREETSGFIAFPRSACSKSKNSCRLGCWQACQGSVCSGIRWQQMRFVLGAVTFPAVAARGPCAAGTGVDVLALAGIASALGFCCLWSLAWFGC